MEPNIITQSKNERRRVMESMTPPILDMTSNPEITLCLMEPASVGKDADVLIIINNGDSGTVLAKMSLQDFFASGSEMVYQAESLWDHQTPVDTIYAKAAKEKFARQVKRMIDEWLASS